jgi:xylulokinase
MYSIGIDIGTTNVKTVVINKSGAILESVSSKNDIFFGNNNEVEQDPNQWWNNVLKNFKLIKLKDHKILKEAKIIGVSSQGAGIIPIDSHGNVLHNALIYLDGRAVLEADIINKNFKNIIQKNCFSNKTEPWNPFAKILWFKLNKRDIYDKTYKFLSVSGYINYKLSGKFTINHAEAGINYLFDYNNKKWDKSILDEIGIDINKLPLIKECDEIIGLIKKDISNDTSLNPFAQIIAGGEDTSADTLSVGIDNNKKSYYFMGTSSNFGLCISKNELRIINNVVIFPHVLRDLYLINSTMLSTGSSFEWLSKKIFKNISDRNSFLKKNEKEINKRISYLIFQPFLNGVWSPFNDENASGTIFGLNLSKDTIDLVKMIYEGCSYALVENIENYEANGLKVNDIYITGGITKNMPWCQSISDVSGKKVIVNKFSSSAFGMALLAGSRIGLFDIEDVILNIKENEIVLQPRGDYYNKYKELYSIYKELYKNNKALYPKLKSISNENNENYF